MNINPEIRERVLNARQQLFEASGRLELPTVEAVRRLSTSNRNDASALMGFKVQWIMQSSALCS
jgi:hypothetical protein